MSKTKLGALASTIAMASALPAHASFNFWSWFGFGSGSNTGSSSSVPEIDASAGFFALAAVGAVLLLAIERKRRRA